MIINKKETGTFKGYASDSLITVKQLLSLLDKRENYKEELIEVFEIDENKTEVIQVGNVKTLLESLLNIDSQIERIDIVSKVKDIHLTKMLLEEKALFEIFGITQPFILRQNRSDLLVAETRYSAKSDILDYYHFSKFANYCRDNDYADLIDNIKDYLIQKNSENEKEANLRLVFKNDEEKFFIRALTSADGYRDYGVNFSVIVALMALDTYVKKSKNEVFINDYIVDDSTIYLSFALNKEVRINKDLSLTFNLILENDEIKRNSVSFNGFFKLRYENNDYKSEIVLKPDGIKKDTASYPVDLLNYQHRGGVDKVFNKIEELPSLIDFFIKQVSEDAVKISKIQHPDDVRKFLIKKVDNARKPEFKAYRDRVKSKLTSMAVDNIFMLFELLKDVELLFEHDDIISRDFWRSKLYETLIKGE